MSESSQCEYDLSGFKCKKQIGKGVTSRVYKIVQKLDGSKFALKEIGLNDKECLVCALREGTVIDMQHENLLSYRYLFIGKRPEILERIKKEDVNESRPNTGIENEIEMVKRRFDGESVIDIGYIKNYIEKNILKENINKANIRARSLKKEHSSVNDKDNKNIKSNKNVNKTKKLKNKESKSNFSNNDEFLLKELNSVIMRGFDNSINFELHSDHEDQNTTLDKIIKKEKNFFYLLTEYCEFTLRDFIDLRNDFYFGEKYGYINFEYQDFEIEDNNSSYKRKNKLKYLKCLSENKNKGFITDIEEFCKSKLNQCIFKNNKVCEYKEDVITNEISVGTNALDENKIDVIQNDAIIQNKLNEKKNHSEEKNHSESSIPIDVIQNEKIIYDQNLSKNKTDTIQHRQNKSKDQKECENQITVNIQEYITESVNDKNKNQIIVNNQEFKKELIKDQNESELIDNLSNTDQKEMTVNKKKTLTKENYSNSNLAITKRKQIKKKKITSYDSFGIQKRLPKCFIKESFKPDLTINVSFFIKILKSILKGVIFLHSKNVVHNDIKPSNIMFTDKLIPKIGDFGMTFKVKDRSAIHFDEKSFTFKVIDNFNYKDFHPDFKKLGIVFFEMLWPLKTAMERYKLIKDIETKNKLPDVFVAMYPNESRFIMKCLVYRSDKNVTAEYLYNSLCKLCIINK